jgi:hypothetical protein
VADWNGQQGASNGYWQYLDDIRNRTWADMQLGQSGGLTAMVGGGSEPTAAIANCHDNPGLGACADHPDSMLLIPSGFDIGRRDPAIAFLVPTSGTLLFSGEFVATAAAGDHLLWFYRNTRDDLLQRVVVNTVSSDAHGFSVEVDALAGDRILIAVGLSEPGTPVPMAMRVFVSRTSNPSRCALALRFEMRSGAQWNVECNQFAYTGRRYNETSTNYDDLTNPTIIPSVIPELGHAMQFLSGDYLFPGQDLNTPAGAFDQSGDFTVQFWAAFPAGYNFTFGHFYADVDSGPNNQATSGTDIGVGSSGELDAFVGLGRGDPNQHTSLPSNLPDTGWHHLRLVRDTAAGQLIMCRDGARVVQGALPRDANSTGAQAPYLGRTPLDNFAYFTGALDDVRFFSRALPCI